MRHRVVLVLLLIILIGLLLYTLPPAGESPSTPTAVSDALGGGDNEGYARAYEPRPFNFPEDHGPHPEFRTEWWYFTGNLIATGGRRFGYQLTVFRIALSPTAPQPDSAWRTHQIYMGHFAVTDVQGNRHYSFERFSRAAVGLAGAQAIPFRVWLEDWAVTGMQDDLFPLRLRAQEDDIAIDLMLHTAKSPVLQGNQGLSQKSGEPGNASYYYSYTRLPTQGRVRLNGNDFIVSGSSWLDREWSTSALGPEQSGWDWFALQLDDGRDLMFYRLRRNDGEIDPHSKGSLVAADGSSLVLRHNDVELEVLETWTSPHSGDRYPVRWAVRLPSEGINLTIVAQVMDQEMRVSVRYWEGAVAVQGYGAGRPVTGQGYLEMTRYEE